MIQSVDLVRQHAEIEEEVLTAIREVLRHGQFILGPEVAAFEEEVARFLGVDHVIGVNSGTDALRLALQVHDIEEGDEVLTVSHSYFATASAICLSGATPVFVDIDETMLLDPELLQQHLTPRTRAVLPVHLNGYPCDMEPIRAFCDEHDLILIEDCAQAIGATYRGAKVGTFGTGCFSLHPIKALGACGDGGFISTDDAEVAAKLRQLRTIGHVDRDHIRWISGNSRLDTMQAAILLVKMKRLDAYLRRRREHAGAYFAELPPELIAMPSHDDREGIFAQFVIRHPRRDKFIAALAKRGVAARVHYPIPIHRQEAFRQLGGSELPRTEEVVAEIISLPISFELTDDERARVVSAAHEAHRELV